MGLFLFLKSLLVFLRIITVLSKYYAQKHSFHFPFCIIFCTTFTMKQSRLISSSSSSSCMTSPQAKRRVGETGERTAGQKAIVCEKMLILFFQFLFFFLIILFLFCNYILFNMVGEKDKKQMWNGRVVREGETHMHIYICMYCIYKINYN